MEAPPRPDVKPRPTERPSRPAPGPGPGRPNPFRRKTIQPGHEPRPKMQDRVYAEAVELLKRKGMDEFVR